jgi:hypothetical protein
MPPFPPKPNCPTRRGHSAKPLEIRWLRARMRNRFDLAREQVYAEYPEVQSLWSALAEGAMSFAR